MCPSLTFCQASQVWHPRWPGPLNQEETLEMCFPSLWAGKLRQILGTSVRAEMRLNESLGS